MSRRRRPELTFAQLVDASLACKLASVVVHAQELLSVDGREADRIALQAVANDPDVVAWIKALGPLAPLKRRA